MLNTVRYFFSGSIKNVPSVELLSVGTVVILLGSFRFSGSSSKLIQEVVVGGALEDNTVGGEDLGGRGGGEGVVLKEFFRLSLGLWRPASANSTHDFPLALYLLGLLPFDDIESSLGKEIFIFSSRLTNGLGAGSFDPTKSSKLVGLMGVVLLGLSIGQVLISDLRCLTGTIGTPRDL